MRGKVGQGGHDPLQATYPEDMPTSEVLLLQVAHLKLQGEDVQQPRLQGMSSPHSVSNVPPPQASKALPKPCAHLGPLHLHVHSLNKSIIKSSTILHASNQVCLCHLGLDSLLEIPKSPPPKQFILLRKQPTSMWP